MSSVSLFVQVYAEMGALFEANKSDIEINDDNKMIPRWVQIFCQ